MICSYSIKFVIFMFFLDVFWNYFDDFIFFICRFNIWYRYLSNFVVYFFIFSNDSIETTTIATTVSGIANSHTAPKKTVYQAKLMDYSSTPNLKQKVTFEGEVIMVSPNNKLKFNFLNCIFSNSSWVTCNFTFFYRKLSNFSFLSIFSNIYWFTKHFVMYVDLVKILTF